MLHLERVVELQPSEIEDRRRLMRLLYQCDHFERSLDHARQIATALPQDWRPFHIMAACHIALGCNELAADAATRTIELDPTQAEAWYFRALARKELGEIQAAVSDALKSRDLDAADPRFQELLDSLR